MAALNGNGPNATVAGYGFGSDDPCPCCDQVGTTVLLETEITCLCCLCTFPLYNVVRWVCQCQV